MLASTVELLRSHAEVLAAVRRRHTHVLVDEFQVCIVLCCVTPVCSDLSQKLRPADPALSCRCWWPCDATSRDDW